MDKYALAVNVNRLRGKIEAQGNMPQLGISLLICTILLVFAWIVLEKNGTAVERIKGVE